MITPKLTRRNYRIGCSVRPSDYSRGIRKIAAQGSRCGETTPRCFRLTFTFVDQEQRRTLFFGQLNRLALATSQVVQFRIWSRGERANLKPGGKTFQPTLHRERSFVAS